MSFQYANHGSLRQLICDDNTMFPWPIRLGMAQDIADGMSYLHRLRIIHRDLTSPNCLIKKRGHELSAIVSDLGLATKLPENPEEEMSVVGSPFWMAPECLHGKLYNETADIFSYGIILCEMIARITSDPEDLPRLSNFGLDEESFRAIVRNTCPSCPEAFLQLVVSCCKMTPTVRPAFKNIVIKIENIASEYNSNNNDRTQEGYPLARKSRSQSSVQPPRLNFHNTATTTRHRQQKPKIMRSNSDTGPRPDMMIRTRSQVNPFDTPDLQGGRVKLWDSSTDRTKPYSLELETLDDVSLLLMQDRRDSIPIEEKRGRMKKRISQSLPSSPEMNRKMKQDEENSFVEELEDQEFEDTFLQDRPVDLTQPRRRSLLIRDYSLPLTWREDLKKPRSRSSDNFSKRLDSGLSSFGDEDAEMEDRMSHLQLEDGREVFAPVQSNQVKNIVKHIRSDTR
ncbi:dual specificity testis-specific protein kinase 2-like [Amphiura filiformis]|uniref:dual specificity testis-specific protein kinase 2-like n=1 Tax=Amphiura filiformis TaxID=82378 RepID=UPI003B215477